jgi:hexosaminidase
MKKIACSLIIIATACWGYAGAPQPDHKAPIEKLSLIPTPWMITQGEGRFEFSSKVKIYLGEAKNEEDRFSAAQLSEEIHSALGLTPRTATAAGGRCIIIGSPKSSKAVREHLKKFALSLPDSFGDEGYLIHISPEKILVAAHSGAGIFYGIQTLKQLIRSGMEGSSLPCLEILDRPALRWRGWMDDISRGPIPTVGFLKDVIRTMAEYKQNFFTLYTEHVFKLKSHPDIAPQDGISAEEIAELASFAQKYHIELIGNAQSFGHMENILRSPFYDRIEENSSVLNPASDATYRFLKEVYSEIVPAYKSGFFHINCDEVYGLERGRSKPMVDSIGTGGVYAYHINKINDIIKQYGKRILMWGDIAVSNPDIIQKLPKDLIVISWGYDAAESFDEAILPFKKTGYEFMVAPGVSCWSQVWPDMSNAAVNISNYVRDGAKLGAMGMMNTAWDDDGENFFDYNWHGLLWGAECSWHPAKPLSGEDGARDREGRLKEFNRSFDNVFYGTGGVSEALFQFDSLRHYPIRDVMRDNAIWSSMLDMYPDTAEREARKNNEALVQQAGMLLERLQNLKSRVQRNGPTLEFAAFAAKRALFTGKKNLARIALSGAMRSGKSEDIASAKAILTALLDELYQLKSEYAELWNRENRGWWLDRIYDKYNRLGFQLLNLDKTVSIEPENALAGSSRRISLRTAFNDQKVYYTSDGSQPTLRSALYTGPFEINSTSLIRARVLAEDNSYDLAEKFVMVHKAVGKLRRLNSAYSRYSPAYAAGGDMGLVDGLRGSDRFNDGRWQGYQGQDVNIELDFGDRTEIRRVSMSFLQDSYSWILMPTELQIWSSDDGEKYELAGTLKNTIDPRQEGTIVHDFISEFKDLKTRYLKIVGKNPGKLPAWHHAAGNDAFIFSDEIVVE